MSFPTTLDTFPDTATLDAATLGGAASPTRHAVRHNDLGVAIAALEAKVGIDGSAVTTSLDYKAAHAGTVSSITSTGSTITVTSGTGPTANVDFNLGHANTWTAVQTFSTNGALSAPGVPATGTWITGGTATTCKPYVLIEPTGTTSTGWSTSGTGLGVNAPSGFTGNIQDWQVAGATVASVCKNADNDPGNFRTNKTYGWTGISENTARIQWQGTWMLFYAGGNEIGGFRSTGLELDGSRVLMWNTSGLSTTIDTGLARNAAGVVEINNGTAGTYRWVLDAGRTRLTADVTNATATFANLSGLSQTLIAGRKYIGTMFVRASDSTAVDGLQFDFNGGTATATSFVADLIGTPVGATTGVIDSTALATAITITTATTGDIGYLFAVEIVVNAGGTFIPRLAQVSHTTGTATARLGSYLNLRDCTN